MIHKPTSDDIGMAVVYVVLSPVLTLAFFRFGMWVLDEAGRLAARDEIVGSWIAYAVLLPVGMRLCCCAWERGLGVWRHCVRGCLERINDGAENAGGGGGVAVQAVACGRA